VRTSERHQLKQDKFAETTKDLISSAVQHRASLVWSAIAVIVILVAVFGSWYYWSYRTQKANEALGLAVETYNAALIPSGGAGEEGKYHTAQERARAARAQFQQVAERYGYTKPGRMARYMAGLTAIDSGDAQAGEAELKSVSESGNQELAALAKLALAGVYRSSNRNSDALRLYRELIDHPSASVSKPMAELELASFYDATNQHSEAGKVYEQIITRDPQSAAATIAQQRLQNVK
jgi:predicted negative regulator of RcsB-dependent stress response